MDDILTFIIANIRIILIVLYILFLIGIQIFIEKRLNILNLRHMQKIGGGYGSYGLLTLHKKLKILLRFLMISLFIAGTTIIITLV
ncbi:MAG: hypothetical protein PHS92_03615 [Candidatus Gracilibacteria bacterium]|nr:hypothetical protein [Candidatus Gracilibacteria bacterium]